MKSVFDVKLGKFIFVGFINTAVGILIMFGLYNFAGLSYWISSAANYILTSILSFFLNKYFTFKYAGDGIKSSLKFAVNIVCCYIMAYGMAKPLISFFMRGISDRWKDNVAMVLGMCFFTAFNYLGQRFFVFRERNADC